MRLTPRTALFLCGSTLVGSGSAFAGEWRTPRKDPQRTALAAGPVELSAPNVAWRTFLGGTPSHWTARFADVALTGPLTQEHSIVARGGRFVALNMQTQQLLWETEVLGPGSVAGIADLDGDSLVEVVVQTQTQAHVLDGASGDVRWSSSTELVETMGMTRVRDMDGDGLPDVYIDNGVGANYGIDAASVYTFASGQGVKLWDFPLIGPDPFTISSGSDGLMDLNGDGEIEVVLPSYTTARVLRGSDGSELTTLTAPPGVPFGSLQHASSFSVDLDGVGDLEVVLVQENYFVTTQSGPLVVAYGVDVASGASQPLWSVQAGGPNAQFASTADLLSDLDGDGVSEVIFSYRVDNEAWRTKVLAGANGALIQELVGSRLEGAFDFDGLPGKELALASDAGLSVYRFDPAALVPLSQIGATIPDRRGVSQQSSELRASTWLDQKLAILARPGQSSLLLAGELTTDFNLKNVVTFASIDGYAFTNGEWVKEHTYEPKLGHITGVIDADYATRPYEQLAFGASTGLVDILNQNMEVTNGLAWIGGQRLGAFVGGAYARPNPLIAADAAGPFILLPNTAIGTVVADASYASWLIPPIPRWWDDELTHVSVLDLDGQTRVAGVSGGTTLVALDSQTGQGAAVAMPNGFPGGAPFPVRTGTGTVVGIDWRNFASQIFQTGVDFSQGQIVFQGEPIQFGGHFGSSVGDFDQDGVDEWYSMSFGTLWRRDVTTGQAQPFASLPTIGYSTPMVTTHPQGGPALMIQSGWAEVGLVDGLGQVSWTNPVVEQVNAMMGAILECPMGRRFVTPGTLSPTISTHDLVTGAVVATRTFAGGSAFANVAEAEAAGEIPGVMGHVSGLASLDGAPAALVGSSDGHLYALDPCTLDLRWALDLGASVGDPIIGDTDGDGEDEILISAADGFLYALDSSSFPAPFITLMGQPAGGPLEVGAGASIGVSWPEIDAAPSYEVSLVGPDDKPVWDPIYKPVNGTSTEISLAGALAKRPYRVVVRVAGADPGQEGFSTSVVVADTMAPAFTMTPAGGPAAVLTIDASDDIALDHALLMVGDAAVAEALLDGLTSTKTLQWAPTIADLGSNVSLTVVVVDSAGLRTESTVEAAVDESGNVSFPTGGPGSGSGGGGGEGGNTSGTGGADAGSDAGANSPEGPNDLDNELDLEGCACETTPRGSGSAGVWFGLALALGVSRRRRASA